MRISILGFSLLEMLISFLILSWILLSFNAMAIWSIRTNNQAYYLSQAVSQIHNMCEKLKVFGASNYQNQVANWNIENKKILPNGKGLVSGKYPDFEINLFWGQKTNQKKCGSIQFGKVNCVMETVNL